MHVVEWMGVEWCSTECIRWSGIGTVSRGHRRSARRVRHVVSVAMEMALTVEGFWQLMKLGDYVL